ncbi:HIT family protein [Antribacter sp. KLBMP9083]|uniref:HIT family protein n=1 Tax=Antribacter soli TaxID=2910976 RepID=A0AA41QEQ5_9MICO|nr:HIT family protein [Antribacter soli]MCF4121281.1 HIT family protein [Antribacter soli]
MPTHLDPRWLSRPPGHVHADLAEPCPFCAIVRGDAEAHIVAETDETVCFLDRLPATYGHVLVVPKQHVVDLFDIPDEVFGQVMAAAKRVADALRDSCAASGINLVHASGRAADQTVFHFHVHVVPRYDGDSIVVFPRLADPSRANEVAERLRTALTTAPHQAPTESSHS